MNNYITIQEGKHDLSIPVYNTKQLMEIFENEILYNDVEDTEEYMNSFPDEYMTRFHQWQKDNKVIETHRYDYYFEEDIQREYEAMEAGKDMTDLMLESYAW